ncbi:MAG: hypothetical protein LUE31_03840 [Lachnospiraceae bacterium]|nr:hypothetical protein [Lachnospiraceae bacterium]
MANIKIEDGKILYRKLLKSCELPLEKLRWAYLQKEDVNSKLCCGSYSTEIDRVIVVTEDGKKEMFQFESMEEARELLARIQAARPDLAIGYTEANRAQYEV